jgi:hypothetical protein
MKFLIQIQHFVSDRWRHHLMGMLSLKNMKHHLQILENWGDNLNKFIMLDYLQYLKIYTCWFVNFSYFLELILSYVGVQAYFMSTREGVDSKTYHSRIGRFMLNYKVNSAFF